MRAAVTRSPAGGGRCRSETGAPSGPRRRAGAAFIRQLAGAPRATSPSPSSGRAAFTQQLGLATLGAHVTFSTGCQGAGPPPGVLMRVRRPFRSAAPAPAGGLHGPLREGRRKDPGATGSPLVPREPHVSRPRADPPAAPGKTSLPGRGPAIQSRSPAGHDRGRTVFPGGGGGDLEASIEQHGMDRHPFGTHGRGQAHFGDRSAVAGAERRNAAPATSRNRSRRRGTGRRAGTDPRVTATASGAPRPPGLPLRGTPARRGIAR